MKRELIKRLIAGQPVERCGFWMGHPHNDTWPILHRYFGTTGELDLRHKLKDDVLWRSPQFYPSAYQAPDGRRIFDIAPDLAKCPRAPLADCQSVSELRWGRI